MKASEARAYIERWEAVAQIKQKELQSASPVENWRRLNAIRQRAARLGITRDVDDGEMAVFLRWANLRMKHAISS